MDVEVTIGNYFPEVGNTARRRRLRVVFPTEGKLFPIVTDNVHQLFVLLYLKQSENQIYRKQLHFASNNDVIVRFVRSVYYSDTLELIQYYLAIKASLFNKNYSVL